MVDNIFMADHTGKCCDCSEIKTLDTMVKKDGIKGLYHCIDCEIKEQARELDIYFSPKFSELPIDKQNKIKKIIAWCIG